MNKINIFILAAGLGERLRPITHHIPKPLIPILGKPVLQYILESISAFQFHKIGLNLYHKRETIEEWVAHCSLNDKIILFPEETVLGTGGAIKNAEGFLNEGTFLVHNSDIFTDIHLGTLLEHHRSSKNLATLAVHDYPKFNCLVLDDKGFLEDIKGIQTSPSLNRQKLAFTGIAVYEPEFLKFLPPGTSSVVDAWMKAISVGKEIGTLDVSGYCWSDVGTPYAYISSVFEALRMDGETVYIHPSLRKCKKVEMQGNVVIEEGCLLEEGAFLKNCILLPGSHIGKGNSPVPPRNKSIPTFKKKGDIMERTEGLIENCIIGPGFKISINESEITGLSIKDGRQLIGTGGSDRKYYRIRKDNETVVLMQCNSDDPDFERHIEYSYFFLKHSIPVPELIKVESERTHAIFEDAGDISLYSYLKCPREKTEVENIYREVINVMILIHNVTTGYVSECPLLQKRVFNYEYFRWETD